MSSFDMSCVDVRGGPCPKCGLHGLLLRDSGSYDPDGLRTIVHLDEQGEQHTCTLRTDAARISILSGRWWSVVPDRDVDGPVGVLIARLRQVEAERDLLGRKVQAFLELADIAAAGHSPIWPEQIYRIVTTDPGDTQ